MDERTVPAARLLSVASQAGMRRPSAIDGGRFHSPLRGSSGMGGRLRRQPSPDSRLNPSLHPNEAMDTFGERTIGWMRRRVKRQVNSRTFAGNVHGERVSY
jgi:hypothetical protein